MYISNTEPFAINDEAIQNIASVYATTNGTAHFNNIAASGDISCNKIISSNINAGNLDLSGNITIGGKLSLSEKEKPIILSILVGNYTGPIVDLSGNAYSATNYMCKILRQGNYQIQIGIKKGYWWTQSTKWENWCWGVVEFTPISNYTILSNVTTDQVISNSMARIAAGELVWLADNYINGGNGSYGVFNSNGNVQVVVPPSQYQ